MKRRRFLTSLSALPFLSFLRPEEPTKIPGLERIVVKASATGTRIEFGSDEPVLNVWMGSSPESVELIWAWKANGVKYRAYTLLVHPSYAERCGASMGMETGSLVVDELEISRVEDWA